MKMRAGLRTAALACGAGYVLFFFSERAFWSVWRADDDAPAMVGGWLAYSLLAYVVLCVTHWSRVGDATGLIVAGALFGWLVEGVYAATLYGDPSMPFPLTIAWTALAWHGPVSFVIGLFVLRRCLQRPGFGPALGISVGLGLFCGLWAVGWTAEAPPTAAEPAALAAHLAAATALLAISQHAITLARPDRFSPSPIAFATCIGALSLWFALVDVPSVPWAPSLLLPLLFAAVAILTVRRRAADGMTSVARLARPAEPTNVVALAAIPATATAVYAGCRAPEVATATHLPMAALMILAGSSTFLAAFIRAATQRRARRESRTI